ncbi:MAG: MFS transporter [Hyphomicrobiales bacterium]|nr:MAG: MFS transporter [Hyphomicrobiales bacterium]
MKTALALGALFLGAFAVGTTEFVPAGLVPAISRDMAVSIPTVGLLISIYAASVAIGGPILSLLTSRFPRKPMILILMAIFFAGHIVAATAPNFETLMGARVLIALAHGSYFGLMAIIAMSLVTPGRQGMALAFTFGGISVANVLGVPLGTAIGDALGWRMTFWIVGGVGIAAGLAMALFVPREAAHREQHASMAEQFRVLANPQVYLTYLMIAVMMVGFFAMLTFVSPWLTQVGGVPSAYVPWVLLLFGVGGLVSTLIGGKLNDIAPNRTLLFSFVFWTGVFALALFAPGNPTVAVLAVLGIGLTNFNNATLQTRILRGASAAPDLASTLISSVFNIGIAIGAYLASYSLERGMSYADIPWFGVVFSIAAGIICVLTLAFERRRRLAALAA